MDASHPCPLKFDKLFKIDNMKSKCRVVLLSDNRLSRTAELNKSQMATNQKTNGNE